MTAADQVWNRAATESGGEVPGPGDCALASLLCAHGLIMNGGVHHALECLQPRELAAAIDGYAYFGLDDVAALLRGAASDPVLREWTDDTESVANGRYAKFVPDDDHLVNRFRVVFRERVNQFAPVDPE